MDIKLRDDERINSILELARFFNKNNIEYLLALGTACRFYEDGDIYKPSETHDIDFHVWSEDFARLKDSLGELESSGWKIISVESYKIQLEKSNIIAEIIFLFKVGTQVCFSTSDPVNGRSCYSEELFVGDVCKLNGKEVSIVSRDYCKQHYG